MFMKITSVDVYVLKTPLEEPFAFSQGWVRQRAATLVRIQTDNGLSGWGEAFAQGLEPPEISSAVIRHALVPVVLNRDALDINVLWYEMYNKTRDYGRKGSVMAGISAIDIALWDLAGKYYRQPVCQLLGGAFRKKVVPYATGFYRITGQGEAARLAEEAVQHRASGFTAMKVKLGFGVDDDIKVMRAIDDALKADQRADNRAGDGISYSCELMVDTNHAYGRAEALRLGRALEEYNIRWYEEPLVPEDLEGYRELRSALSIPIAAGENEHSIYGYNQLLDVIDIAQPDVGSCGGLTAARDITAMAQAKGVMVNPHVWGSAIAQAASLQLIASLPVPHHSLFATQPVLEYDRSSHPYRSELIEEPWELRDGEITVPDGPGLGIEVRMDVIEKYLSTDT